MSNRRANVLNQTCTTVANIEPCSVDRNNFYADIYTARYFIFGFGFGICCLISFVYIGVLRLPALLNSVIWGSIFATIAIVFALAYYLFWVAGVWANEEPPTWSDSSITATRITSYCLFVVGAILFLLMICLRKQIQLAIGCVKETGKAVTHMPAILFVPIVQAAGFIVSTLVITVYGIYLASQGQITVLELPVNLSGLEITVRTIDH